MTLNLSSDGKDANRVSFRLKETLGQPAQPKMGSVIVVVILEIREGRQWFVRKTRPLRAASQVLVDPPKLTLTAREAILFPAN